MESEKKINEVKIIRPQKRFQEKFLASSADITIGGGAAGVGKSVALTMESLYDVDKKKFRAIYFRRKLVDLDGLIDEGQNIYSGLIPKPEYNDSYKKWTFPNGATISYSHLQYEKDKFNHMGQEYALIGFDELTTFTDTQFFFLLTRNRSTSGAKPRIRATCNPDPDSWVAKLIDWWIGEDGFPIKERAGVIRYFVIDGNGVNDIIWGNTKEEVYLKAKNTIDRLVKKSNGKVTKDIFIKSLTFIPGSIFDNEILLNINPGYLGSLNAQDSVTRSQLLEGNWKVKETGDEMVKMPEFLKMVKRPPQRNGRLAITSDIALGGRDKMVIFAWDGFHLFDCKVISVSDGLEVVDAIKSMMMKWHINPSNVTFDANNLGGFITGFIKNTVPFFNNGKADNTNYYTNRKTECADKWADRMNDRNTDANNKLLYSIDPILANTNFGERTLMEHLIHERKAMRLADSSYDGKKSLIKKTEMKQLLGHSPDFIETFFMIEHLYSSNKTYKGHICW